ncbi:molybdenum cofactor biosynthesis protein MoaE [Methanoregula sp.]|jgi:molybdopterin synthase catalytic subunit|uniref:molybdenum cofactor biosynthesis protein MoaE n=1 Tax=Methanoregula sp. TaxID=2052170 RepID=UPI003C196CF5
MIAIQHEDVDINRLVHEAKCPGTGAVVLFDGVVRDDDIREMELEAYEEVALRELEKIAEDAKKLHNLFHVDIVHRIGRLSVGENILIIVASAGHRPEAYAGSRYIIEEIKKGVPIWKKEFRKDGDRWVPGEHPHGSGKPSR